MAACLCRRLRRPSGTLDRSIEELDEKLRAGGAGRRASSSARSASATRRCGCASPAATLAEQLGRAFDHLADEETEEPAADDPRLGLRGLGNAAAAATAARSRQPARDDRLHRRRGTAFRVAACARPAQRVRPRDLESAGSGAATRTSCRSGSRPRPFARSSTGGSPIAARCFCTAAAVGQAAGGVLLVGAGGSGKSTCALSCLTSDLLYAGDDYVAVELRPEPRVLSLFCSGKLEPDHAALLPASSVSELRRRRRARREVGLLCRRAVSRSECAAAFRCGRSSRLACSGTEPRLHAADAGAGAWRRSRRARCSSSFRRGKRRCRRWRDCSGTSRRSASTSAARPSSIPPTIERLLDELAS